MVKRYVVYAANCICDAPPNSDGQYVLVADYDALAARLAEAVRLLKDGYPARAVIEVLTDGAPALQPCGHPWKAQHDSKCILCSSPGDATSAQLAEAQRFSHSAPAGCNHFPGQVNCEWCTEVPHE